MFLDLCNRPETISVYIFLDCLPGYYKTNCSEPCRYPSYGLGCQKECKCTEKSCHHVFGCSDHKLDGKRSLRKKTERGIFTSIYNAYSRSKGSTVLRVISIMNKINIDILF